MFKRSTVLDPRVLDDRIFDNFLRTPKKCQINLLIIDK